MNEFYVYLYLREDGTPYYVGKGKGKRAFSKNRTINIPEDKTRIVFHSENLTEDEAFTLEKELIAKYGRKDNGTGILRNLTDGGEGSSGLIVSDNLKIKLSEKMKKYMARPEVKSKMSMLNTVYKKGKKLSKDVREKMSISQKERWETYQFSEKTISEIKQRMSGDNNPSKRPEVRKKISQAAKRRTNDPNYVYKLTDQGRKKLSEQISGENNPSKRPEFREKIKKTWTPEKRKQHSEMIKECFRKKREAKQAFANTLTKFFSE
jgi:hypothetical protein